MFAMHVRIVHLVFNYRCPTLRLPMVPCADQVEQLLASGASTYICDERGRTAKDVAMEHGMQNVSPHIAALLRVMW
jgi:hypothetical protein